jgi:hypothetical protein
MIENVLAGNEYQNIKTGDIYLVLAIAKSSEDPSRKFVIYERKGVFTSEPWSRPLDLFKEKFREIS